MNYYPKKNVVIIGGGPSGLGAALMLAHRGWQDITVIEKRPSADYYEPDKSFSYQIDGRGQKLTDLLGITPKLAKLSVPSTDFYFTLIKKDGKRHTRKLPIADSQRKTAYWLPRATFVQLLYQEIEQHWQNSIKVFFETECQEIRLNQEQLVIIVQSPQQQQFSLNPNLLIGCDGLNSVVRQTLAQMASPTEDFTMQHFPSPSSGLKYKVLSLPPKFPLSEQFGDISESTMAYGIRSVFKERNQAISLGLLPFKNPDLPRTANIITYPEHKIWQLKTPEELTQFLKAAFPQLPLEKIITSEEIVRFLASDGGKFPIPQYCSQLFKIWGHPEENKGTAVILLGDAVHCFPPDIGQGVNSALEDIYVFQEILAQNQDNLGLALPEYQKQRLPDIKALIRLAQWSYPWQYNQNLWAKKIWNLNFFLRFILNRFFPFLFNSHSFLLIQNEQLSYSEILAKSKRTTKLLLILLVLLLLSLILFINNMTQA